MLGVRHDEHFMKAHDALNVTNMYGITSSALKFYSNKRLRESLELFNERTELCFLRERMHLINNSRKPSAYCKASFVERLICFGAYNCECHIILYVIIFNMSHIAINK